MTPRLHPLSSLAAVLAAGAMVGCGNLSEDDLFFFAGLPQKELVEMRPAGEPSQIDEEGQALEAECEGEDLRCHVRKTARDLNGLSFMFIDIIDAVVAYPPSQRSRGRRVWGPIYDDKKDTTARFEIVRDGDLFRFCAHGGGGRVADREIRALDCDTDADEASGMAQVLSGSFTPGEIQGARARSGAGTLVLELSRIEDTKGLGQRLTVDFDNTESRTDLHLEISRAPLPGSVLDRDVVTYDFEREEDGSGDLSFDAFADIAPDLPGLENLAIQAAWNTEQAGRAEAQVARVANLEEPVFTAVQCWNAGLDTVYVEANENSAGDEGLCAFPALP